MPTATHDGVRLHYETAGSGDAVAFVPDLGCGAWLWGWQAPTLAGPHETITWDPRGCGRSSAADDYAVESMADDLESVLADHGVANAAVVGAGMGGMVALSYALRYSRADRLALLGTAATGDRFDAGAFLGPPEDLDALTSSDFRDAHPEEVERIATWRTGEDAGPEVRRAQADAVARFDVSDSLYEITVPSLVLHGEDDAVVPIEAGESLADGLPRGSFEGFPEGSHFFFVEQTRLATDALAGFLGSDDSR